jgi:signal transduction histidine kinase
VKRENMRNTRECTNGRQGGFFSIPRFHREYNEADQTTGIIGYALMASVFTGLFYIPAVVRVTGVTPAEWLTVIGIHLTFDLLPYYAFKNLYKSAFYSLGIEIMTLGLACLLVFFTEDISTPFWGFFFLYGCVMANSCSLNIYYSLAVLAAPLATGGLFHRYGYLADPGSDWFRIVLLSLIGLTLYLFIGAMSDKWRTVAKKNAELEWTLAMEKERHRIARELHDGIGSSFTTSLMMLDLIAKKTLSVDGCGRQVEGLKELLNEGLTDLRDLVWAEGSAASTVGDVTSYIEEKIVRMSDADGMELATTIELERENIPVTPLVGLNMVRIAQETLANAVKHSGASRIEVALAEKAGIFTLRIKDNGRGFDAASLRANGNGLGNMGKRCGEMGGTFEIYSAPGSGTEVAAAIALATASPLE